MTKTKKRIGSFGLALAITYLVFILVCLFGEVLGFKLYMSSLPEQPAQNSGSLNVEGLEVFLIILFGIYVAIALAIIGILTLIPAIIALKATKPNVARKMSIWLIVMEFIGAVVCMACIFIFISFYVSVIAIVLKVLYLAVAGLSIFSAILAIKGLKLFKDVPAEVRI